jgi:predicted GTPase
LPYLQTLVDRRSSIILFVGATGCGRSKVLPFKIS